MAEKDEGRTVQTVVIGGMAALAGTALGMLLAAKPVEAAPPDERFDYLLQLLEHLAQGNVTIISLLEQLVTAAGMPGVPGVPGVEVTVKAPWVAKEPEHIYSYAIRTVGTFYSDKMVDWTEGKRLLIKVESSLNVDCDVQVIGNFVDDMPMASDINGPIDIAANENHSIGLAFDDYHPFIGLRVTTAVAPTAGILNIWAVVQT